MSTLRAQLAEIRRQAERKGWKVARNKKYYRLRCPCGKHQKSMNLTPSDPNYPRNLVGWLRRTGCW